jgi:hypothetical protein
MSRLSILVVVIASSSWLPAHADETPSLSLYGFARLDVLVDDSRMSDVAAPDVVMPEPANGQLDSEITMTPRLSRIGLSIDQWHATDHTQGEGKLEVDFGGGNGSDAIRLRHAYGALLYRRRIELLAGHTWDLASPMFPSAQNDTQLRYAGNLGDRRPQVRLELLPTDRIRIGVAAAATGYLDRMDLDGDGQLDGFASGLPMLQWIAEYRERVRGDQLIRFGISGHAARTELADGTRHPASSINAHVFVPVEKKVMLLAEGYVGKNLADIGGGIGQGVDPMTMDSVHSKGGWVEAAVLPTSRHMLAVGSSVDTASSADVSPGARTSNRTFYGVLRYKPTSSLQLGLEYLNWRTRYKDVGDGVANRFDLHASVLF